MIRPIVAALLAASLLSPAAAADPPSHSRAHRHARAARARVVAVPVVPLAPLVTGPVGAARPAEPSPTALLLPGSAPLPSSVDLSPVFLAQTRCGPGFSPDALQACRRHGELKVACDASGRDCVPLPPDPIPYGPGAASRLAY